MTDLIRRADAIEAVHKYFVKEIDKTPHEIDEDGFDVYTDMPTVNSLFACNKELSKALKALPSADAVEYESTVTLNSPISISAEAVQGEWDCMIADGTDGSHWYEYECSHCGEVVLRPWNFCPNCGAKMSKGGDSE